jgi:hypothetical protein
MQFMFLCWWSVVQTFYMSLIVLLLVNRCGCIVTHLLMQCLLISFKNIFMNSTIYFPRKEDLLTVALFTSGWNCVEDFRVPELAIIVQMCSSKQTFPCPGYRHSPLHRAQFEGLYSFVTRHTCSLFQICWMLQYNSWYTYFDALYLGHPSFESHKGTLLIETQCLFVF